MPTATAARPTVVTGPSNDPMNEIGELTKRLKLPYLRRALTEVIPTAKAQRWDPAEIVRVLLAEEAAGRDATNPRTRRKRAGFPNGKTFDVWDEAKSSIGRATQQALRTHDRQRARSASHNAALRQLANRLVGILHGCLKTGTLYDEKTAWSHHLIEAAA